jgi:aerobic-type carbon monoxide dehydrogenase small subunit (CoxS/CutS family)
MNPTPTHTVLDINGIRQQVPPGITVAAALGLFAQGITRLSVQADPRAALCGMGICQECRVLINGQIRLACQTLCVSDMVVRTYMSTFEESMP